MAQRNRRRIGGRIDERRQLRHVGIGAIVQRQGAGVAQLQHGQRGEALGHRGDAEEGCGTRLLLRRNVRPAGRAAVDKRSPGYDAIGESGQLVLVGKLRRDGIEFGQGGGDAVGTAGFVKGGRWQV